jgi:electron transport complex protein RnfB
MGSDSVPGFVARVDALLPQTQCTRCGYPACLPYAEAIALHTAPINQCPPGGKRTIEALARVTGRQVMPLNPANGIEAPARVAFIDEARCIGCARCLPPCPVDAIVGAAKFMHTVLAERCTGCELCVAPCPVDCIDMRERDAPGDDGASADSDAPSPESNRTRYAAHLERLQRHISQRQSELAAKKASAALRAQ